MWWIADQARLRIEREAIEALAAEWFRGPVWSVDCNLRLTLDFELTLNRGRFALRLIYHNTFPASPPSVRPADGETRLSWHQYGAGGDLCLEIRNDNWTPNVTGAEMIQSARRLLDAETPEEDGSQVFAPSAHDFPESLNLRSEHWRLYLDPWAQIALALEKDDSLPIEVGIDFESGETVMAHLLSIGGDGDSTKPLLTPKELRHTCMICSGTTFSLGVPAEAIKKVDTVETLQELLGPKMDLRTEDPWVVLLGAEDGSVTLFWHFRNETELRRFKTLPAPFDARRTGISASDLAEKKVGVVGLGSLGSKVVVSLVRAGVRKVVLVDGDILHVGNLERHDADWRDVGRHKADQLKHRLKLIHRQVEVHSYRSAIGAQVSSQEAANVNNALASCDLLIDATANPDVFNQLADLSIRHNRNLVWGAVYAGGIGGEVARARFGRDPSPYDIRAVLNQYYETSEETPPIATGRSYDGSIGQETPMQASDADVSVFAAHMAGMALDALAETEPSQYDAHAYLVGLKRAWLFEGPFDTHPIVADAPVRTANSTGSEPIEAEFIQSLFEDAIGEPEDS